MPANGKLHDFADSLRRLNKYTSVYLTRALIVLNILLLGAWSLAAHRHRTELVVTSQLDGIVSFTTAMPHSPLFYHHCVKPQPEKNMLNWPVRAFAQLTRIRPGPLTNVGPSNKSLLAVAVGRDGMPAVEFLMTKFPPSHFDVILFHYDSSNWNHFGWYSNVTAVRALGQSKFWFAKRFLGPDIVKGYRHIFLWDEDVVPSASFSAADYVETLETYHIHFSQPAIVMNAHYQNVLGRHSSGIGRWVNFVEIMAPVFSVDAWIHCVHRMIQPDLIWGWGLDQSWYRVCGSIGWQGTEVIPGQTRGGFCRMAVLDSQTALHLNTKSMKRPNQPSVKSALSNQRIGELNEEIVNQIVRDTCNKAANGCVDWIGPGYAKTLREIHAIDSLDCSACIENKELWTNHLLVK